MERRGGSLCVVALNDLWLFVRLGELCRSVYSTLWHYMYVWGTHTMLSVFVAAGACWSVSLTAIVTGLCSSDSTSSLITALHTASIPVLSCHLCVCIFSNGRRCACWSVSLTVTMMAVLSSLSGWPLSLTGQWHSNTLTG